jgi:hypothetical protein
MTKYNSTDFKTVLETEDDAARTNWGGNWRMPTSSELERLYMSVNTEWVTNYNNTNVNGLLCTDKTDSDKVLFFPASGCCHNGNVDRVSLNDYWTSSVYTGNDYKNARYLGFTSSNVSWGNANRRYYGFTIRPVVGES